MHTRMHFRCMRMRVRYRAWLAITLLYRLTVIPGVYGHLQKHIYILSY